MELDYEKELQLVVDELTKQKIAVLATSLNDKVTIRSMSIVNDGLTIFFQTDSRMDKIIQIQGNENVAFSVGIMNIEGKAKVLGNASGQPLFINLFKEKHPGSYKMYTGMEAEVVVSVDIQRIKIWMYINEQPYIKIIDIEKNQVELKEYLCNR